MILDKKLYICIDFDGTCVTHEYPNIGRSIGAESVIKRLIEEGHKIILFTMRSGRELEEAVSWFEKNIGKLYAVNKNPTQKRWTSSPKVYGNLYIDDAALGCPLTHNKSICEKPYVDWVEVEDILFNSQEEI
jgi:hypothetical protein